MAQSQAELGDGVVGFDLGGVRVPLNAEALDEATRDFEPLFLRESNLMSVKIARSSVELSFRDDSL